MSDQPEKLAPVNKAATFLMALEKPVLAELLKHLRADELSHLMREYEAEQSRSPAAEHMAAVAREFLDKRPGEASNRFKEALILAFGQEAAQRIARRDQWRKIAEQVSAASLAALIRDERPEAIAIVLSQLPASYASDVLNALPEQMRGRSIERMALSEQVSPAALDAILCALTESFKGGDGGEGERAGAQRAAAMLNRLDLKSSQGILEQIRTTDPGRAAAIERLMFHFEDLPLLDSRTLQRVLSEAKPERLAISLKGSSDEERSKLLEALPDQVRKVIDQEMEDSGNVPAREISLARNEIAAIAVEMDQAGKIRIHPEEDNPP